MEREGRRKIIDHLRFNIKVLGIEIVAKRTLKISQSIREKDQPTSLVNLGSTETKKISNPNNN
jgi:hypothetical protein